MAYQSSVASTSLSGAVTQQFIQLLGHGTIVREVGAYGVYYLFLRPMYALTQIVVDPDDVFVDVTIHVHAETKERRLVYCFYNGTRRTSIGISATVSEDIERVGTDLATNLNDPVWRQYFVRNVRIKPDARPMAAPGESYPAILTTAQVARYLSIGEKTIRNWTSEGKIPFKKAGANVRYRKNEIDDALDAGTLGKAGTAAKSKKGKTAKTRT